MKKLKYILLLALTVGLFNSCENYEDRDVDQIRDNNVNFVTYKYLTQNLGMTADGSESTKQIKIFATGPGIADLNNDLTVTVSVDSSSTAEEGDHFRIENKTVTLSPSNNFLAEVDLIMMSEGNSAPMDGTPEFDDYVAPYVNLNVESVTGDESVIASVKMTKLTLNFTPPNPYAGDYSAEIWYFHPTAGGSYPDDPYSHQVNDKTLSAVTGRKCETGFAIWGDYGYICWITVNSDNSVNFEVADTWGYDVKLGDPNDASKVSHFDPETGQIYLYYHYAGSGGNRIFWEIFTPNF